MISSGLNCPSSGMDDTAIGGLTQFQQLFAIIPCAPKDFKP